MEGEKKVSFVCKSAQPFVQGTVRSRRCYRLRRAVSPRSPLAAATSAASGLDTLPDPRKATSPPSSHTLLLRATARYRLLCAVHLPALRLCARAHSPLGPRPPHTRHSRRLRLTSPLWPLAMTTITLCYDVVSPWTLFAYQGASRVALHRVCGRSPAMPLQC